MVYVGKNCMILDPIERYMRDEAIKQGIEQGIEQERTRTILNLLSKLSKDDLISLGYTANEIENALRA